MTTQPDDDGRYVTVGQLQAWAKDVLEHVAIQNIRLRDLHCESPDQIIDGPFDVKSQLAFDGEQVDEQVVETISYYTVSAFTKADNPLTGEPDLAWQVSCQLRATFNAKDSKQSLPKFSDDQVDALAGVVGVIHAHPYARETVQSMTSRMGYPPFTLDGLVPLTARPDETVINFTNTDRSRA